MQDLPVRVQTQQPEVRCRTTASRPNRRPRKFSDPAGAGRLRACERGRILRFPGGMTMHEAHCKAAEMHQLAAQAHRTAAEHNEKSDCTTAEWHSARAREYSDHAYTLARQGHNKSGEIESL